MTPLPADTYTLLIKHLIKQLRSKTQYWFPQNFIITNNNNVYIRSISAPSFELDSVVSGVVVTAVHI